MVIKKIKDIDVLSTDKVYCCYFDEGNLQVIDVKEDLKLTTQVTRN